jgi:hypothetical protein
MRRCQGLTLSHLPKDDFFRRVTDIGAMNKGYAFSLQAGRLETLVGFRTEPKVRLSEETDWQQQFVASLCVKRTNQLQR